MTRVAFGEKSFTLIEILVVIGIVVILSSLVFANFKKSGRELGLERAANKLVIDIRYMQKMALEARIVEGTIAPAYGIYIDLNPPRNHFILFADTGSERWKFDGGDRMLEDFVIEEKDVIINSLCFFTGPDLSGDSICNPPDSIINPSILFIPPDPVIYFGHGQSAKITLGLTDGSKTKVIFIIYRGLIGIEQ